MTPKSLLVAAPPNEAATRLAAHLRDAGCVVHTVTNGVEALEQALFQRYDGLVLDLGIELIPATHLREILRANPRTRKLPIRLVNLGGVPVPEGIDVVGNPLLSLEWLFPEEETAPGDRGRIEADLSELSLPDLLQMLEHNRRSGRVLLERDDVQGEILVHEGMLTGVRLGTARGLKALARLLAWERGRLRFDPGTPSEEGEAYPIQQWLYDAVRLRDEAAAFAQRYPPGTRIRLRSNIELTHRLEPTAEEVLLLVDFFGRIDEILERVAAPDAEIYRALEGLAEAGLIEVSLPQGQDDRSAWPDIDLAPRWRNVFRHGRLPIVWVVGVDAHFAELFRAEPRLQARLIERRSLFNPGRFGGNGWLLRVGPDARIWLRWQGVAGAIPTFLLRPGLEVAGVVLVATEGEEFDQLMALAEPLVERGIRCVWFPLARSHSRQGASWMTLVWDDVPGRVVLPGEDPLASFWEALGSVLTDASTD